jgi:hypothetical protein
VSGVTKDNKSGGFVCFSFSSTQRYHFNVTISRSIMTDEHLNIIREDGTPDPDVWAIGDASQIENARLPATAQGRHIVYFIYETRKVDHRLFI